MHFDVIWELQEFFIRCSARLIRFFQTYIFDCFYLWVCLLKFSTKLQWVPIFLWECLKKLVGLRLKGCGWVERSKVQGRWWGGGLLWYFGWWYIYNNNKFMSKIPHKGPGGRDGEGDCFGRLFGEFLPFVWWLFMNIAQNFKVLGWW